MIPHAETLIPLAGLPTCIYNVVQGLGRNVSGFGVTPALNPKPSALSPKP